MSNSFSEIFRPKKPSQLIGETQIAVCNSLLHKVEEGNIIQEILFSGDSGVGKTTIAYIYIRALLGIDEDSDVDRYIYNLNCSSETGIDNIRDLKDRMTYMPFDSAYTIIYLDEIHGLSNSAQNALLKAIEPPPAHVIVIASTTDPQKLIPTLRSRFTEYRLDRPSISDFQKKAFWISKKLNHPVDDKIRDEIITGASGNIRTFDRLLQQYFDGSYKGLNGIGDVDNENSLVKVLLYQNPSISDVFKLVDNCTDYPKLANGMVGYCIKVMMNPNNPKNIERAAKIIKVFGNGLSRNVSDRIGFYTKLLEVYQEL